MDIAESDSSEEHVVVDDDGERFDVFLSHSSADKPFVERLAEQLRREGLRPWLDRWELVGGETFQPGLGEGIAASRACAVFLGPSDLGAWTRAEVEVAVDRAARDPDFRVFFVLLPGLPDPIDHTKVSPFLGLRTWVDYRAGLDSTRAFHELVSAIQGVPPGPAVPLEPRGGESPYRGLDVFDEEHASVFFGRAADVQRLLELLKGTRFLAVLGASGSGKSSLVRAGLIPALRSEKRWEIAVLRPGAHPLEALAAQLGQLGGGAMQATLDGLAADPRTLHLAVSLALADGAPGTRLALVVDQFEEVFTLCRDDAERTAFFDNLLYAASVPDGRCIVVLTMRSDFYHRCGAYPKLVQQLAARQYVVSPLQREGLRQAIVEPARAVGLAFEPGLAATILEDVADQPGALPLLEHALLELWERRAGGLLTLSAYRETGGVNGAIAKRADEVYESLGRQGQELARRAFLRLTQPGEGTEDTRRRADISEIASGDSGGEAEQVLHSLVDARLLTSSRDETGGEVVEVAHEALIRGWPLLRGWLDEDRAGLRIHRRLTEAADEWERVERDDALLYRGIRLDEAVAWRERPDADLNRREREFLDASVELRDREARAVEEQRERELRDAQNLAHANARAKRWLFAAAAVLLVGLLVSGYFGWRARDSQKEAQEQRDRALSLVLAAGSADNLATDPELSLLLALQAVDRSRTTPAREALRQAVGAARWRTVIRPRGGQLDASDLGGDGRFVVTADGRPAVTLWDARTGRPVRELRGHRAPVRSAELSPDGRRVATAADDGSVRVWDARSGALLGEVPGAHDRAAADDFEPVADFSPDGKLVHAAGKRVTKLWDVPARRVVAELPVPGAPFDVDVDISPDGRRVATTRLLEDATQIWDVATGRLERTLRAPISMARFSPDGRRIATGGGIGGPARLWDVRTGERLATLRPRPGIEVDPVAFSPDGRKVVGVFLSDAYVFDARTGRGTARLRGHSDFVSSAVFSPDSRRVLTASDDGTARIWDAAKARSLRVLRGHTRAVAAAVYTRDASTIATLAEDGTTRVWDAGSGTLEFGTDRGASYASFTPDGRAVVDGVEGTAIPVWDARTGRELAVLTAAGQELGGAVTSPAGNLVGTSLDDRVALWSTRTWRRARTLEPLDDSVSSLAFSRDGRRVVASSYGGVVRVADTATGRPVAEAVLPEVEDVELIGDGAEVVVVWDETRTVGGATYFYGRVGSWDTRTGRRRLWYRHPRGSLSELDLSRDARRLVASGPEHAVVFDVPARRRLVTIEEPDTASGLLAKAGLSPDGARLVTANSDNVARLWDARTGRRLRELRGHTGSVTDAGFSSDGRYVATIADDGTGRIWDSSTGATVEVYEHSPDANLPTIQFAPKDERVLTADGTAARIFRCRLCVPLEPQLRLARRLVARSLSPEERRAYGLPADG